MRPGGSSSSSSTTTAMWFCSSAYVVMTFVALLHMGALAGSVKAISVHIQHDDHFVAVSEKNFVINGEPFFVNGWNSYWMMTQAVEERTRHRVVSILQRGAAVGMTVCRTWAFNDATYNALQMYPGVYSEQTFQALDFVIAEAARHGVRLLLTLVNNLPEYGGKSRYVQWAREDGLDLSPLTDDHFYTNPTIREYYKAHVKRVLTRVNSITKVEYRHDPVIFGWELINEPRSSDDSSATALQAWVEEMAAHVKSLDNRHLLTVGLEGFYKKGGKGSFWANPTHAPHSGTDFIQNHQVAGIDFATAHAYPDLWLPWESHDVKQKFFNEWVDAHIKDADEILKKPVLFSEFALYDHEHRDTLYKSIYEKVHASAVVRGAAGGAIAWQLLDEQMAHVWNDGFAVFPAKDFSVIDIMKQQSCRLKALSTGIDRDHRVCGEPPAKSRPQPFPQRPFEVILAEHQQSVAP